ncbi:MAG: nicotinamide-nucleotide adenylyltransferase [Methanobacteriota archaeon]
MNALFVGRFQPFHNGHLMVLQRLSTEYAVVIIGIGSSQYSGTQENPFSAEEREQMIGESLHAEGIENYRIVQIPDIHDPPHWVAHVCTIVSDFDVVVSNNPLTQQLFSEKGYRVVGTPVYKRKSFSGKEIRRRIIHGEPWQDLVPPSVVRLINQRDGVERIKKVSSS